METKQPRHFTACDEGATFQVWHEIVGVFSVIHVIGTGIVKAEHATQGLPFGDPSGDMAQRTIPRCKACHGQVQNCIFKS